MSTYKKLETIATEITLCIQFFFILKERGLNIYYNVVIQRVIANRQEQIVKSIDDIQDIE